MQTREADEMDNRDFSDLGDKIRDTVQSAIDTKDFRQLNKTISNTVNFALDEARRQMVKGMGQGERGDQANQRTQAERGGQANYGTQAGRGDQTNRGGRANDGAQAASGKQPNRGPVEKDYHTAYRNSWEEKKMAGSSPGYRAFQNSGPEDNVWTRSGRQAARNDIKKAVQDNGFNAVMRRPGRVAGILYTVFGGIGLGVTGIMALVVWILALTVKPLLGAMIGSTLLLAVLCGVFGTMLGTGIGMRARLKRAEAYVKLAGSRKYCEIKELAQNVGRTPKFVARDLQKLIEKGILPEAHIDEQKTCLILDQDTYRQYLESQKALKQRQQEALLEQEKKKELPNRKPSGTAADSKEKQELPPELAAMIAQGQGYLQTLRDANEAIPGEVISHKLTRLEHVIGQIFEAVEKHPEQMGEMERFMEYYLPTTVKLVEAYRDFDSAKVAGENVASAKQDIEETLDTINGAFERLLDDLYKDKAMDASTDAAVLQTMLKKDGWGESDFNRKQEDE